MSLFVSVVLFATMALSQPPAPDESKDQGASWVSWIAPVVVVGSVVTLLVALMLKKGRGQGAPSGDGRDGGAPDPYRMMERGAAGAALRPGGMRHLGTAAATLTVAELLRGASVTVPIPSRNLEAEVTIRPSTEAQAIRRQLVAFAGSIQCLPADFIPIAQRYAGEIFEAFEAFLLLQQNDTLTHLLLPYMRFRPDTRSIATNDDINRADVVFVGGEPGHLSFSDRYRLLTQLIDPARPTRILAAGWEGNTVLLPHMFKAYLLAHRSWGPERRELLEAFFAVMGTELIRFWLEAGRELPYADTVLEGWDESRWPPGIANERLLRMLRERKPGERIIVTCMPLSLGFLQAFVYNLTIDAYIALPETSNNPPEEAVILGRIVSLLRNTAVVELLPFGQLDIIGDSEEPLRKLMYLCANPECVGKGNHRCAACKTVAYCGEVCQRSHWKKHKADCKPLVSRHENVAVVERCDTAASAAAAAAVDVVAAAAPAPTAAPAPVALDDYKALEEALDRDDVGVIAEDVFLLNNGLLEEFIAFDEDRILRLISRLSQHALNNATLYYHLQALLRTFIQKATLQGVSQEDPATQLRALIVAAAEQHDVLVKLAHAAQNFKSDKEGFLRRQKEAEEAAARERAAEPLRLQREVEALMRAVNDKHPHALEQLVAKLQELQKVQKTDAVVPLLTKLKGLIKSLKRTQGGSALTTLESLVERWPL